MKKREVIGYLAKNTVLFPVRLVARRFRGHTLPRLAVQYMLTVNSAHKEARKESIRLRRRMRRQNGLPPHAARELERMLRRRGRTLEDTIPIVDRETQLIHWWKPKQ